MRKGFRRFIVALAVLSLFGIGALLARTMWDQYKSDLMWKIVDALPETAHWIRDFHRVSVEDGRKMWEVAAKEARYYDESQLVVVREPMLSFSIDEGREVALRGQEGRVYLEDQDVIRVELEGEILVRLGEYAVETDLARYERRSQLITAPGSVRVTGPQLILSGDALTVRIDDQKLILTGNVKTRLQPKP